MLDNPIKLSYDDGVCPDCGLEIPDDVVEGQGCANCEHAFYKEMPCERAWDKRYKEWYCVNDHTSCCWNDGHNICSHEGNSLSPLEEKGIVEENGRWKCLDCGHEFSACMGDNEIPEVCDCQRENVND